MTITTRAVKGSALTWAEVDQNWADLVTDIGAKQDTLVSATNIKTVNGTSLLGSGDLVVSGGGSSTPHPFLFMGA